MASKEERRERVMAKIMRHFAEITRKVFISWRDEITKAKNLRARHAKKLLQGALTRTFMAWKTVWGHSKKAQKLFLRCLFRQTHKMFLTWQDYNMECRGRSSHFQSILKIRARRILLAALFQWNRRTMESLSRSFEYEAGAASSLLVKQSLVSVFVAKCYRAMTVAIVRSFHTWKYQFTRILIQQNLLGFSNSLQV